MATNSKDFAQDFRDRYMELTRRLMVLNLLDKPKTGYEISVAIHEESNHVFPLWQVVSTLLILERAGAVNRIRQDEKLYYQITSQGKECLKLALLEFYSLQEGLEQVLNQGKKLA